MHDLSFIFGGCHHFSFRDYIDNAGYPNVIPVWATNDLEKHTWKTEMSLTKIKALKVDLHKYKNIPAFFLNTYLIFSRHI